MVNFSSKPSSIGVMWIINNDWMTTSVMKHKLPWYLHWSFWFVASQQLSGDSWPIAAKGPRGTLTSGGPALLTHQAMQLELHTDKYKETHYWNLLRGVNQSLMCMHACINLWLQLVSPLDGTMLPKINLGRVMTFIAWDLNVSEEADFYDLPEEAKHEVRGPCFHVLSIDVDHRAANSRSRVKCQHQILLY